MNCGFCNIKLTDTEPIYSVGTRNRRVSCCVWCYHFLSAERGAAMPDEYDDLEPVSLVATTKITRQDREFLKQLRIRW